jgi:hypothetical protein
MDKPMVNIKKIIYKVISYHYLSNYNKILKSYKKLKWYLLLYKKQNLSDIIDNEWKNI